MHITQMINTALVTSLLFFCPVNAEEITCAWDETTRITLLRRPVPTSIGIYTDGMDESITHETGMIDDIHYDILRASSNEHTIIQVDYSETPVFLDELKDQNLIDHGYQYAGGINGGFFYNTDYEYGRPVGAVRKYNAWTYWQGNENAPAYGSGYVTAYFTGNDMWFRYHGWSNGQWCGDNCWDWDGYHIDAMNGISGAYTYFVNGGEADITASASGDIDYRRFGRALTIFAQNEEREYLLITIYGTLSEDTVLEMLRNLHVYNAIRMDGGGSTQMVYETELVREVSPELADTAVNEAVHLKGRRYLGIVLIEDYKIPVHTQANEESSVTGNATLHEHHYLYRIKKSDNGSWYEISPDHWINAAEEQISFLQTEQTRKDHKR